MGVGVYRNQPVVSAGFSAARWFGRPSDVLVHQGDLRALPPVKRGKGQKKKRVHKPKVVFPC